jgi:hypothetical protein
MMMQDEAVSIASAARLQFGLKERCSLLSAEKRIIEIFADGRSIRDEIHPPGAVLDRIAWVVTFVMDSWAAELAVDDHTEQIIRFRRFRSGTIE